MEQKVDTIFNESTKWNVKIYHMQNNVCRCRMFTGNKHFL